MSCLPLLGSLADSLRIVGLPLTLILITAACHIFLIADLGACQTIHTP